MVVVVVVMLAGCGLHSVFGKHHQIGTAVSASTDLSTDCHESSEHSRPRQLFLALLSNGHPCLRPGSHCVPSPSALVEI